MIKQPSLITTILTLSSLLNFKAILATTIGCSVQLGSNFWNLNPLRRTQEKGDYQLSFKNKNGNQLLSFNFCSHSYNPCSTEISSDNREGLSDFASIYMGTSTKGNQCHHLSLDDMDEAIASYYDPEDYSQGINIKFVSDEICEDTKTPYTLTVQVDCEEDLFESSPTLVSSSISTNSCNPKVTLKSDAGCSDSAFSKLYRSVVKSEGLIAIILLSLGVFLTFFGQRFQSITMFIASSSATFFVTSFIFYKFLIPEYMPTWVLLGALVVSGLLGLVVGLLALMWAKLGIFLIGGWIGGTSGMMIYNAFISPLIAGKGGNTFFWTVIIICVIAGGITTVFLFKHALIVGTCLCGSYCLIRALSIILGGYPNEILIYFELQNGSYLTMPFSFYTYVVLYFGLALFGFFIQEGIGFKKKKEENEEKDKKKDHDEEKETAPLLEKKD